MSHQHTLSQILKISALTAAALVAVATGAEAGRGGHGGHHGSGSSASNPPRPVTMRPEDLNGSRPVHVVVRDHRSPAISRDPGRAPGGVVVGSMPRPGWGSANVRDHRDPVIVRDHRDPVIVRDHRTPVVVRDHRGGQPWYAPRSGRPWGTYADGPRQPYPRQPVIRDHRAER
jgi:hypothetical protein